MIAEEVAQAFPELVVRNQDGQPETVKYQDLTPLLLNEVQKQQKHEREQESKLAAQEKTIAVQQKRLEELEARDKAREERLAKLEQFIPAAEKSGAPKTAGLKAE